MSKTYHFGSQDSIRKVYLESHDHRIVIDKPQPWNDTESAQVEAWEETESQ